jgi:hypothetical protein
MAISRMQQPQQMQGGLGSLTDPRFDQQAMYNDGGMLEQDRVRDPQRQGYFLGKLVKKATRAVKKVVKSPIGKAALMGAIGFGIPGTSFGGLLGRASFGGAAKGLFGNVGGIGQLLGSGGKFSTLGDLFRVGGKARAGLSIPRLLAGGLGATAIAAPFFMGGDDDDVVEEVDMQDPAFQVQRARNYYSGQGDAGAGLDFMPRKEYVMRNFYAADGGRAGYAGGMLVEEDDEEEFIRSRAGNFMRMRPAYLNMGGSAGQAQAEQMLMMEYVKYKNKGGNLSFEQFVKAVMQQASPSGAGMEQPMAMAANGGRIGLLAGGPVPDSTVPGYTTPAGYNKFDYRSGGVPVRGGKQEGGIMETEVSEEVMPLLDMGGKEKDYRETGGFVELGRKERADDVPARLSKNEFVFTADAVRNAGGGDIDRGAEVMENLMNNLEQGGEISEESQGLEGAQAMYDQQQMLQSRIV